MKPAPDINALEWLAGADEDRTFLSVVTFAELRAGVDWLPEGRKRERLDSWLRDELPLRFEGRIVPVDSSIADSSGPAYSPAVPCWPAYRRDGCAISRDRCGAGVSVSYPESDGFRGFGNSAGESLESGLAWAAPRPHVSTWVCAFCVYQAIILAGGWAG